jgi:hypothetical protein
MQVLIYHNITTVADLATVGDPEAVAEMARDPRNGKVLVIFRRMRPATVPPIEPGDTLRLVGKLDLPATTALKAAHAAYAAGNSPYECDPGVVEYRTWNVRSLSVGDVVVADGKTLACAAWGFTEIDSLDAYKIPEETA